jgi:hypothetical protein
MFNYNTLIIGTAIYVIFCLAGLSSGIWGLYFGMFIAGGIIGKLVNGGVISGLKYGIIIGLTGSIFIALIYWPNWHLIFSNELNPNNSILKLFTYSMTFTGLGCIASSSVNKFLSK